MGFGPTLQVRMWMWGKNMIVGCRKLWPALSADKLWGFIFLVAICSSNLGCWQTHAKWWITFQGKGSRAYATHFTFMGYTTLVYHWKDCTKDLTGVDEPACINITFKYPFTIHVCDLLPVLDLAIFTMSLVMLCYTLTEMCQCHNRRLGCIPGVYKHQTQLLQVPELDLG